MLEKTNVRGELRGCDRDFQNVAVSNLETPMGKVPQAVLRTEDIVSFKVVNFPADEFEQTE
jgi:gem associated protein 7